MQNYLYSHMCTSTCWLLQVYIRRHAYIPTLVHTYRRRYTQTCVPNRIPLILTRGPPPLNRNWKSFIYVYIYIYIYVPIYLYLLSHVGVLLRLLLLLLLWLLFLLLLLPLALAFAPREPRESKIGLKGWGCL